MLTGSSQAAVLLTIDLTEPNQVTISATTGTSDITTNGSDGTGVYFENFYGTAGTDLAETLVVGDLTSAENSSNNSPNLFRANSGTDPGSQSMVLDFFGVNASSSNLVSEGSPFSLTHLLFPGALTCGH